MRAYGLLKASFRLPEQILPIRNLVRHHEMLVEYRSAHIQHVQKALTQMNLRLTNVLSDITGVTRMEIIRAVLAGERNPEVLAQFRDDRSKKSEVDVPPQDLGTPPATPRQGKRRKNQAHFDLALALYRMTGVDLTQIGGLDALTVQNVLSEIGTDMSKWPMVKHFASWLHLCPNNKITGGKIIYTEVLPTQNRASTALRVAAVSLKHGDSALGAYYRRKRSQSGAPAAITATAHKLAQIIILC